MTSVISSSRRTLLQVSGAAAVAAALPLRAQTPTVLKLHTFQPAESGVWRSMLLPWMAKIEAASNGRLRFEASPSMRLGGAPAQLYDQVLSGKADIIFTLPGYTPGRFPHTEVFELPFMLSNAEATSRAYWEFMHTMAPQDFKDVQVLALNVHGPGVIHTASKQVNRVEDLQGLKLRSPTRQVNRLLSFLGATGVSMPAPAIPDGLISGAINGCVVPWEMAPAVRVPELTKFHAELAPVGGSLYTSTFVTAMNQAKYNSLPADLRKVIDAHSGPATSAWLGKTQQSLDVAGRQAAVQRGNSITTMDLAEAQKVRRMSRLVEVEWAEQINKSGGNGYKMLDTARSLIERHTKELARA